MKREILYITVIIVLLFVVFFSRFKKFNTKEVSIIKVDSIARPKVLESTPVKHFPKRQRPIVINNYITSDKHKERVLADLKEKYNVNADSLVILKELLELSKKRQYNEVFEDSLGIYTANIETKGYLNSIDFSYKLKKRTIMGYDKVITKIEKPPNRILLGVDTSFNNNMMNIEGSLLYQTKKGHSYGLGYSTNKFLTLKYYYSVFNYRK